MMMERAPLLQSNESNPSSQRILNFLFCVYSITPLWHLMLTTSVIMYGVTYYAKECEYQKQAQRSGGSLRGSTNVYFCSSIVSFPADDEVQHERAIKRKAMEEYYERHGGKPH